jgi:hypothetical protein
VTDPTPSADEEDLGPDRAARPAGPGDRRRFLLGLGEDVKDPLAQQCQRPALRLLKRFQVLVDLLSGHSSIVPVSRTFEHLKEDDVKKHAQNHNDRAQRRQRY